MTTGRTFTAHLVGDLRHGHQPGDDLSKITDAIVEDMAAWQRRPPRPVVSGVVDRRDRDQGPGLPSTPTGPWYVVIGVNVNMERRNADVPRPLAGGRRAVEGAKQWMTMLTELRNRGIAERVDRVLRDGPQGNCPTRNPHEPWPDATVQTCVVHLVRNSFALRVEEKHWGQITRRACERSTPAPTVEAADGPVRATVSRRQQLA